ncbi:hypothetical protein RRG08_044410 [Elysia crispata]|uniref:Uncharacterized protein n=1 Tax=Elysia crispata TaxID=231223 RepID=A0AAE1DMB9_9GAST|nr:hypothetical protein RRG08_044410 [Elysia crispata]
MPFTLRATSEGSDLYLRAHSLKLGSVCRATPLVFFKTSLRRELQITPRPNSRQCLNSRSLLSVVRTFYQLNHLASRKHSTDLQNLELDLLGNVRGIVNAVKDGTRLAGRVGVRPVDCY